MLRTVNPRFSPHALISTPPPPRFSPHRTLLYRCDREKATGDCMRSYVNMARRFGRFGRSKYVPKYTARREYTSRVQEWPCEIELACDQVRSYVNSEALESFRSLAHFLTRFGRFGRSERSGRLYVNQPLSTKLNAKMRKILIGFIIKY